MITYNQLINKYSCHHHQAKELILHYSRYDQATLFSKLNQPIDFDLGVFIKAMKRCILGEPLQYIIGYTYFLDTKIKLNYHVFIPRPETELLVAEIIEKTQSYFGSKNIIIADICSGSGAIAIALAKYLQQQTYGLEISLSALEVAKKNNQINKTKVAFVYSDIDQFLIKKNIKVDVLVSNPPYIKPNSQLEASVVSYEPTIALFDKDQDGMSFYRHILFNHHLTTNKKALIAFEIDPSQKLAMEKLIKKTLAQAHYYFMYDYQRLVRGVIIFK